MPNRPPISILIYSEFGGGKTTFLASMPKPILALQFDRFGKETPLLKLGTATGLMQKQVGTIMIPYQQVTDAAGNVIVQIEYFHDADARDPKAYNNFLIHRMPEVHREMGSWATVGIDSLTFAEYAARKWDEYSLNKGHKDGRSHYAQSKNMLEELLYSSLAAMPVNIVVTAHVDEKMSQIHGEILRSPAAPGTLKKKIGAAFQEVYHLYKYRDTDGALQRALQTEGDETWQAQTQIDAPNPCWPSYEALWVNYDKGVSG